MSFIHTVVVISSKEFLSEPIFVIVWNAVLCKNTSRSIFHQIPVHHTPPPRADHWIVPRCRDPMLSSVRTRRHASPGCALNLGGGHNGEGGVVLNSIKIPWSCEKIDSSGIVGTGRWHFCICIFFYVKIHFALEGFLQTFHLKIFFNLNFHCVPKCLLSVSSVWIVLKICCRPLR